MVDERPVIDGVRRPHRSLADFIAPLADMRFTLDQIVGLPRLATLPGLEAASADVVDAIVAHNPQVVFARCEERGYSL